MDNWRKQLNFDPLPPLLASESKALQYSVRRDLLGEQVGSPHGLWQLPKAQRILKKQLADGAWPQYATYYTGAIMALLIQAGYADDPRIEKAFQWLLAMRQDDQGWTIPLLTHKLDRATQYRLASAYAEPLQPDRSKPFSHNWTGMVLRAFAVHPSYRHSKAARVAAHLLKSRFFQPDSYTSYQAASYWVRFDYPYWWNNLVAALDSLSLIGLSSDDEQIKQALKWLADHQEASGLWKVSYARPHEREKETAKARETKLWVSLAICRVFKRLLG